jgi:tetratricopeptide (TPR) repeat protein
MLRAKWSAIVPLLTIAVSGCSDFSKGYNIPSTGTVALDQYLKAHGYARRHSLDHARRFAQMLSLMSRGNYTDALPICDSLLKRQPIFSWGYACRSCIEGHLDMTSKALTDAETAVRQDPSYDVGYAARAECLYQRAITAKSRAAAFSAINDFSKALSLSHADDAKCSYTAGITKCYIFLGDFKKAQQTLEVANLATSREIHELRAAVYGGLGMRKESDRESDLAGQLTPASYVGPDWHQLD